MKKQKSFSDAAQKKEEGAQSAPVDNGDFLGSLQFLEFNPNKFLVHFDKIKSISEGKDVFPVSVEIDPVSFCNHHCAWCVDPLHMEYSLEKEFVFRLLDELKQIGVKGIVFKGGGEPTLHKDFDRLIEKAHSMGFEVGIVTNGSRLWELSAPIVKNCNYVRVSIDGSTAESHKKVHGSSDFEKIIYGVKELLALRKKNRQRHPIIGLSYAMDYSSRELVGEAIKLGDTLGADYVLFRTPFFEEVGREPTMSILESFELKKIFSEESKKYKGKMKVFVDYWVSDSEAKQLDSSLLGSPRRGGIMKKGANGVEHITGKCFASPLLCVVSANKKIYPCCNLRFLDEWSVGTIDYSRGDSFRALWKGEKRRDVLKRMENIECIKYCTHPLSKYNEIIAYLKSEKYHSSFV